MDDAVSESEGDLLAVSINTPPARAVTIVAGGLLRFLPGMVATSALIERARQVPASALAARA